MGALRIGEWFQEVEAETSPMSHQFPEKHRSFYIAEDATDTLDSAATVKKMHSNACPTLEDRPMSFYKHIGLTCQD